MRAHLVALRDEINFIYGYCILDLTVVSLMKLAYTIMRPSYRPHYAYCPSVCPSVCPVRARNSKTKTYENQNRYKRSQDTSKWSANFQLKRSKVKVTERQKNKRNCHIGLYMAYVVTYGRPLKCWLPRRRLQTRPKTVVTCKIKHLQSICRNVLVFYFTCNHRKTFAKMF